MTSKTRRGFDLSSRPKQAGANGSAPITAQSPQQSSSHLQFARKLVGGSGRSEWVLQGLAGPGWGTMDPDDPTGPPRNRGIGATGQQNLSFALFCAQTKGSAFLFFLPPAVHTQQPDSDDNDLHEDDDTRLRHAPPTAPSQLESTRFLEPVAARFFVDFPFPALHSGLPVASRALHPCDAANLATSRELLRT
ncbi:hypothetical protein VTJ04DRAFT_9504 [Mycothermus thermophilus]|uniref:uncharacterized protein n=1 Tax=Humicola insolens TaxID=85995 RepID=UPI0037430B1C